MVSLHAAAILSRWRRGVAMGLLLLLKWSLMHMYIATMALRYSDLVQHVELL